MWKSGGQIKGHRGEECLLMDGEKEGGGRNGDSISSCVYLQAVACVLRD